MNTDKARRQIAASSFSEAIARGAGWVLAAFVASRLVIVAVILLSRLIIVPSQFSHPGGLLSVLTHWDGGWYLKIAQEGYSYSPGAPSSIGFFPLYPILVRLFSAVLVSPPVAAVLISNFCLLAAGLMFYALLQMENDDDAISRAAVTLLMFSPVSFFFSSAYSESTFLLVSVGAFFAARRGNWLGACLCGGALAATRNIGVLIAIPLFVEFVQQVWRPGAGLKPFLTPRILLFGLIPMGLFLFLFYNFLKFGDAFAYVKATAVWGRYLVPPWRTLVNSSTMPHFYQWLFYSVFAAGVLTWTAGFFLKIRASYLVWAGLLLGIYSCGNSLEAIPRYLSVVFPLFIILAVLANRFKWSYDFMFGVSTALLTLTTILSANGYWMT